MTTPSRTTITITHADATLLRALNRYHYLTAGQTSRLLYPRLRDEHRYAQRRLKRLVEAGYALRLRSLPTPRFGAAPHVFTLARAGRQYLEAAGVRTSAYYRPCEEAEKARNHPFILHTLATIDVLIAADRLCQTGPVACPALVCERELRRDPVRVDVFPPAGSPGERRRVAVVPDAWLQLWVRGDHGPCSISVELDRGSEDQAAWRAKVAAICAWALGPYPQVFRTDNLTVAVVTPDATRRDELRVWTARELAQRRLAHLNIFLFTCADPVTTPPPAFFFGDVWYPPGAGAPVLLLDQPDPQADRLGRDHGQEAVIVQL